MKHAFLRSASSVPSRAWRYWRVVPIVCGLVLALLFVAQASALPNFLVTKVDALIGGDGDGRADPGETIEYTVTLQNTGADPATGVTYDDTIDPNTTLVPGSINASPLARNDTYETIGNTLLEVGVTASGNPAVIIAGSLFDNDSEFLGDTFILTAVENDLSAPFDVTTEQGGIVSVETDGNFSYTPPAGFSGTDNFDYVISDNGAVGSGRSAAAVESRSMSSSGSGMSRIMHRRAALAAQAILSIR